MGRNGIYSRFVINNKEREILKKGCKRFNSSDISYIYFIYIDNILIYIGSSKNPIKRMSHYRAMVNKFNGLNVKCIFEIYGPFEYNIALGLEKEQIKNNFLSLKLLNKNGTGKRKKDIKKKRAQSNETTRQSCIKTSLSDKQRVVFYN